MHGYGASFYNSQFAILGKWENDFIEGYAIIIELNDLDQSNNIIRLIKFIMKNYLFIPQ